MGLRASCIGYAYEPLSRWCSHKMQQTLIGCSYILRDSKDLVAKLSLIRCTQPTFYRLDVQDFFLSGTPTALASDATRDIFPPRTRLVCQRALHFMLERQLVSFQDEDELIMLREGASVLPSPCLGHWSFDMIIRRK